MEEQLTQLFNGTITRTPQLIKVWMLIQASANILDYDPHWQGFDGENMEKIRQQRAPDERAILRGDSERPARVRSIHRKRVRPHRRSSGGFNAGIGRGRFPDALR